MSSPAITFAGDRMAVHFDRFDVEAYGLFLRIKRLPEYRVEYLEATETYRISAPARFAAMLGVEVPAADGSGLPLLETLMDDQREILGMALDAKRFACWSDCGLGKTIIGLKFARQVAHRTGGRVLIFTLNEIVTQWIEEARKFYGDTLPIARLDSRAAMRDWAAGGGDRPGMIAITNYEKMNPDASGQEVHELRHLAGVVLDESSRLKTGGGKQKWALIKSTKGVEFKLSLTATPAPNDTMELASQASFLEKMRSEGEIIWTYFSRDPKTHRWTVKPHARQAFFKFMSGWSIYVRDPRKYGWHEGVAVPPEPEVFYHAIKATPEQQQFLFEHEQHAVTGQLGMFAEKDTNAIQRNRLGQVAKGFYYDNTTKPRRVVRVDSHKPAFVADLIRDEAGRGHQVLVWTVFDAEADIVAAAVGCRDVEVLTGKVKDADRRAILNRFSRGKTRVLISRASMLGYGMNFQHCRAMVFSGFNDSYEQFYQALRRAYRFGQEHRLRVHIPYVRDLEEPSLDTILHKQDEHERAIAEMERNYIAARRRITAAPGSIKRSIEREVA